MRVNTRYISSTRGVSGKRGTSHLVAHSHRLCDVFTNHTLCSYVVQSAVLYSRRNFDWCLCWQNVTMWTSQCSSQYWLLTLIAFHLVTPPHKTNRSLLLAFQSYFSHHHHLSTTHARTHAHKRAQCFSSNPDKTKPMFYRHYVQFSTEYHKLNALIPTLIMRETNLKEKRKKEKDKRMTANVLK